MSDLICVGAIGGAHGVRGELRIKSYCANPGDIETYSPLTSENGQTTYNLAIIGATKGGFRARIVGVSSKEQADALKGTRLYARRDQLPNLPDDEYYHSDLMGLTVFDAGGVELGRVKAVLDHGGQDILEVALKGRPDAALIPFTQLIVPTVDLSTGRIVIDPPDGLLPE